VLIEQDEQYFSVIRERVKDWPGTDAKSVFTLNCPPIQADDRLLCFLRNLPVENLLENGQ